MEDPIKMFLKGYATWAYRNLHTYNNNVNLQDPFEVQVAIFDTYIGQSVMVTYFTMIDEFIQFTNSQNVWEDHEIFKTVIQEVIEEYDQ